MKIVVVGGTGTIGKAVVKEFKQRHEVIAVGHNSGDAQVDILDINSIESMYKKLGQVDALISTTGNIHFGPLEKFTPELYDVGLKSKLMGQVNLVMIGMKYLNEKGSFTLTSGILSEDPIRFGASASMINAAIDGYVKGAALELPRGLRINAVSPTVVTESLEQYGRYMRGYESADATRVALAYSKSVEGAQTGQVYRVW